MSSTSIIQSLSTYFQERPDVGQAAYLRISPVGISIGSVTYGAVSHVGRGRINSFSGRSASRLARYVQEAEAEYRYMGTFTLGSEWPRDGEEFKRRLDRFLLVFMQLQKNFCRPSEVGEQSILWFLEFQLRGAPHVHMFYTHRVPWQQAARAWCEAMGDMSIYATCSKLERFKGGRGARVSYARKYASKGVGVTLEGAARALDLHDSLAKVEAGEMTEEELYHEIVANADGSERKHLQKLVPPGYSNVGRFWGVRGLRRTVVATVVVSFEQGGRDLLNVLGKRVREAIRDNNGSLPGYLRKMSWSRGSGVILWGDGKVFEKLIAAVSIQCCKWRLDWDDDPGTAVMISELMNMFHVEQGITDGSTVS